MFDEVHREDLVIGDLVRAVDEAADLELPPLRIDLGHHERGIDAVEALRRRYVRRDPGDRGIERPRRCRRSGRVDRAAHPARAAHTRQRHLLACPLDRTSVAERSADRRRHDRRRGCGTGEAEEGAASRKRQIGRRPHVGTVLHRGERGDCQHDTQRQGACGGRDERGDDRPAGRCERVALRGPRPEHTEREEPEIATTSAGARGSPERPADEQRRHDDRREQDRLVVGSRGLDARLDERSGGHIDEELTDRDHERRHTAAEPREQLAHAERDAGAHDTGCDTDPSGERHRRTGGVVLERPRT